MSFWIYHPVLSASVFALITWVVFSIFTPPREDLSLRIQPKKVGRVRRVGRVRKIGSSSSAGISTSLGSSSYADFLGLKPLLYLGSLFIGFLFAYFLTSSIAISFSFALVSCGIPVLISESRAKRMSAKLQGLWPEILDHIISGLNSGLSLAETLSGLALHGPKATREKFFIFERNLKMNGDFSIALQELQMSFDQATADQVFTVLLLGNSSGSRDTTFTLRVLADFIRADLATRDEIAAKHGWVRNSATIAAVTPWLLLLILSSQPNTIAAYSTLSGALVLFTGLVLTFVAYIWMRIAGKMEQIPRVFQI